MHRVSNFALFVMALVRFMANPCVIHPPKHLIDSEDELKGWGKAAWRLYLGFTLGFQGDSVITQFPLNRGNSSRNLISSLAFNLCLYNLLYLTLKHFSVLFFIIFCIGQSHGSLVF